MDIFIDESGFTGRALLDPDQPYFVVASVDIAPDAAAALLREAFPRFKGDEFKFKALWQRPAHRDGFLRLAEACAKKEFRAFGWVVDKRYCVFQKMIDYLVEPEIHDLGFDFYAQDFAPRFCNQSYAAIHLFGAPGLYETLTDAYDRFSRNPTQDELSILQGTFQAMAGEAPEALTNLLGLLSIGARRFHEHHLIDEFEDTFEIQVTSVLSSIAYWREQTSAPLRLVHDASTNFFSQRDVWDRITSPDVASRLQPVANSPPLQFPLQILETVAADSRTNASVQFADVVAGLLARAHNKRGDDTDFFERLVAAGLGELPLNGLRFEERFPEGPPALLDGPDAIDQMIPVLFPNG